MYTPYVYNIVNHRQKFEGIIFTSPTFRNVDIFRVSIILF